MTCRTTTLMIRKRSNGPFGARSGRPADSGMPVAADPIRLVAANGAGTTGLPESDAVPVPAGPVGETGTGARAGRDATG